MNLNTKHLKLGQTIYQALSQAVGPKKVYALRADSNTTLPFILFARTGYTADSDSDHRHTELISYEIEVRSSSYTESVDLATEVLEVLHSLQGKENIETIALNDSDEDTEDLGAIYVQRLSIDIQTYY